MTKFEKMVIRLLVAIYNCVRAANSSHAFIDKDGDIANSRDGGSDSIAISFATSTTHVYMFEAERKREARNTERIPG